MKETWITLLNSRKFWVLILDTLIAIVLFFGGKYFMPEDFDSIKFLIGALQPVFLMIIYAIAKEDAANALAYYTAALDYYYDQEIEED